MVVSLRHKEEKEGVLADRVPGDGSAASIQLSGVRTLTLSNNELFS